MACLATQIILVIITLGCSVAAAQGFGNDVDAKLKTRIGDSLMIGQHVPAGIQKNAKAFARLDLDDEQEQCMIDWFIMPRPSYRAWWAAYREYKEASKTDLGALETWPDRMESARRTEDARTGATLPTSIG
jgi:hypothetical protein